MNRGETAFRAIDAAREQLEAAANDIWAHPEGPFQEHRAAKVCGELLGKAGFEVEYGAGGVPTAVKASWGTGHPVIGLLGELDALPGLSQAVSTAQQPITPGGYGHGCGHNLLGVAHVGAAIGLKAEMEARKLPGTVIFYGCPAEEVLIGKGFMARGGAFDGIDLSFHWHPGRANVVDLGTISAMNSVKFHFKGVTAHAGGDPHNGRSALDAVELMSVGANYLREHVPTDVRIHYVITDGGMAPNIVPDRATVWYYVRAPRRERVEEVYARLIDVAEGAAKMTGTSVEIEYLGGCYNTLNNRVLGELIHDCMRECPPEPYSAEEIAFARALNQVNPAHTAASRGRYDMAATDELFTGLSPIVSTSSYGSTDVGDVQHIAPGVMFNTTTNNIGATGHSWQITACAGHSIGLKGMLNAAQVMALAGLRVLEEPSICERAKEEFDRAMAGREYVCPIKEGMPIPDLVVRDRQ